MTLHNLYAFLLCVALLHLSQVSSRRGDDAASDCCLDVSNKVIPRRIVTGYKVQSEVFGCRIPAIVFTTVRNRKLCAPHTAHWVKRLMRWCDRVHSSSGQ
ncbi:C-C motif chemokine 19-like [Hypanus sabinus]|uniref:C-C motif chemokine 19-like n=1 Tax=Hypanus sabinus TaxID=79690 RepID=UPI0028C38CE1|nr:C-C motif chemokine 19-like [Hypanus sabinus]